MLSKFDLDRIRAALTTAALHGGLAVSEREAAGDALNSLDSLIEAERCNGWSNWETWNVKLWLDNDAGTVEAIRELAADNALDDGSLAEAIKEFVADLTQGDEPPATMATDLLRGALADVNWQEIARAVADEAKES